MRMFALAFAPAVAALAGCSTHPLPEDFARRNTTEIVQALRCEIAHGVGSLSHLSDEDLRTTVVGVDFKLNMDESNNATAGKLALANPISGGKFAIDLTGSAEKNRKNERNFRIIDTFWKLQAIDSEEQCNKEVQRANFLYPIAGSIGLEEVVTTYWQVKSLSTYNPNPDIAFSDKIIFKTKLSAGISPDITLSSSSAELRITNASVDGEVIREDTHQVTISIATVRPKQRTEAGMDAPRAANEGATQKTYRSPERIESPGFSKSQSPGADAESAVESVVRELNRQRDRDDLRDFAPFRFPE